VRLAASAHSARILLGAAIACAVAAFVACSDEATSSTPATADGGGASSSGGSGTGDDASTSDDSSTTADAPAPSGDTSVDAKIGGVTHTLDRAQFGTETDDAGKPRAHVEAHLGGDPACPSTDPDAAAGAQPEYTLVVSNIPRGAAGESFTKAADGVTAAYFDFVGDQLTGAKPLTQATAVKVSIVATSATTFEFDVEATFPEGTAKGRIAAEYCQSLSL
jgi:hypothetical protein